MLKKILSSTIIKLVLAVIAGILLGFVVGEGFMNVVVTLKYILGQLIFFMVPLIILAFISSSIAKMKGNASRMLGWALGLAYLSSVGAAFMAMFLGYWLIPLLTISPATEGLKEIPELVFKLDIPPVMSVMTALVVAIMVGLATVWTKSQIFETILDNFQKMVLLLIKEKEYLGSFENKQELGKILEQFILRFEREPKNDPELSRFHKFDSKGKVIGVRDMEIVDYIVENVSFFVRGEFQKCLL